jgi:hypothetical protein
LLGTAVFRGMIGVTLFGVFLTPVFHYVPMWLREGRQARTLHGRFLLEENTGTQFGQPYKGVRLVGYNNATKQYEASWTYSLSTAIMTMTGTGKDEGKIIEWTAHFMNEKGAKQSLFVTTRQFDEDHVVVELFGKTPDGEKGPAVETTYTRKKMEKPW